MKKKHLFLLNSLLFVVLFLATQRFCHQQTRGFQLHKVLSMIKKDFPDQQPQLSEKEKEELNALVGQPFYFFGSGGQCYAFLSEDKKTVLKLFKNHHIRFWKLLSSLPLPSVLDGSRQKFLQKTLHQSPAFYESCRVSYVDFKERTGLLYLHLHPTDHFQKKLTLVDKLGVSHQIDLNTTDFALQKKAEFTNPKLKKLIRENDLETAKQCIDSLLGLIVERCQKGIRDRDHNLRRNIGFIGNQAIEIDLGSYSKDESLKQSENLESELLANTQKFKLWLMKRNPVLSLYLSERIDQILKEHEKKD